MSLSSGVDVTQYPFIFFPVGLNLRGRLCVVIGDDREAFEKEAALREVGADVVRIRNWAHVRDEEFRAAFFVISTPQDAGLSARLRALADQHHFLLCCIDQPRFGFVAMQALVKAGPVRLAISTGGIAPRVGKLLKEGLQHALDETFVRFIACLNVQRERNRMALAAAPDRRAAMIAAAEGFAVDVRVRYPAWFPQESHGGPARIVTDSPRDDVDDAELACRIVQELTRRGSTLALAESITGGAITDALVGVPGASRCLRGGVVAYDDAVKAGVLGVDEALLRRHGAVSAEVANAMACGARERLGADIALATTGIAGPTGATPGKPVGLVWFSLAFPRGVVDTESMTFSGERGVVRVQAMMHGLRLLWRAISAPVALLHENR